MLGKHGNEDLALVLVGDCPSPHTVSHPRRTPPTSVASPSIWRISSGPITPSPHSDGRWHESSLRRRRVGYAPRLLFRETRDARTWAFGSRWWRYVDRIGVGIERRTLLFALQCLRHDSLPCVLCFLLRWNGASCQVSGPGPYRLRRAVATPERVCRRRTCEPPSGCAATPGRVLRRSRPRPDRNGRSHFARGQHR